MAKKELRKAISVHHTDTTDVAWDGPAAKTNLKLDQEASYYREAFAWQDPEGDPKTKAAYKFIHHEVSSDGTVGAANIKGCQSGIGVLNGGMGGTTIPDEDRKGVYGHLAAHIKDADLTPPELKSSSDKVDAREYRSFDCELRASAESPNTLVGHAAVFNTPVDIGGMFGTFTERIAPGAFAKTIKDKADVRALFNHEPDNILARTTSGTLKLSEDATGLAVEIDMPDTTLGRDLMTSIKREDISQMSFAFQVVKEEWDDTNPDHPVRTLKEVKLFDVSPVTFPAYPTTDVGVKSAENILAEHRAAVSNIETNEPIQEDHSATDSTTELDYLTAYELRRKQLELLDLED